MRVTVIVFTCSYYKVSSYVPKLNTSYPSSSVIPASIGTFSPSVINSVKDLLLGGKAFSGKLSIDGPILCTAMDGFCIWKMNTRNRMIKIFSCAQVRILPMTSNFNLHGKKLLQFERPPLFFRISKRRMRHKFWNLWTQSVQIKHKYLHSFEPP